jgi:hypothetical protein
LKKIETDGAKDITVKREKFVTPNNAEGLKTYGTMNIAVSESDFKPANYMLLLFRAENVRQQIILQWRGDDTYSDDIAKRITDSIELKPEEAVEEEK